MVVNIGKAVSDKKAQNSAVIIFCHVMTGRTDVECSSNVQTVSFLAKPKDLAGPPKRERIKSVSIWLRCKGEFSVSWSCLSEDALENFHSDFHLRVQDEV